MSGGHFENLCFKISQFADELEREIRENVVENGFGYAPNFNADTIALLKECHKQIQLAGNLAKEVEWLYSGDSSEESFVESVGKIVEKGDEKWL